MNEFAKHKAMVERTLSVLKEKQAGELTHTLLTLFKMIYADLQSAVIGNPIEHHPVVLGHMMEIAKEEKSPYIPFRRAAALALLHDVSPVEKITTQMVADFRKKSPEKADALELKRQQNRILHMREGCAIAHRRMLQLNESTGRVVFDAGDIDAVCEVIRIHDNPSLDIPIPRTNWLAVAFREADRLWMITEEGILADLRRKGKDLNDPALYLAQLNSNVERFKDERSLYRPIESTEGPFCDDETFFRTKGGYKIFLRLLKEGGERYS